jgi:hypothetical protein
MIRLGMLVAVLSAPIPSPEREAAVFAEAIGVGRDEQVWLCTSHNLPNSYASLTAAPLIILLQRS